MKKKFSFFFTLLIAFLIVLPTNIASAQNPVKYNDPIRVLLIPSITFHAETTGSYRLLNLDNQREIQYSGTLTFRHATDRVTVTVGDRNFTSIKGFELIELTSNTENFVTFTSIRRGTQFVPMQYRGSFSINPGQERLSLFNTLDIEDYIRGVVPREMPASWHIEALKAQAVAARNYGNITMKNNPHLVDTVFHQVYWGRTGEDPRTNRAVNETRGIYATHNGTPIQAFFHSSSGGHTENSEQIWSSMLPYIRAVNDPYDRHPSNTNNNWTKQINTSTLKNEVHGNADVRVLSLEVTNRTSGNGARQVRVTSVDNRTGNIITTNLPRSGGADSLRRAFGDPLNSIKFNVSGNASADIKMPNGTTMSTDYLYGYELKTANGANVRITDHTLPVRTRTNVSSLPTAPTIFTFNGSGWGHGLGMSQWGARGMADAGKTYDQILRHYYTGIKVERLN